jgi:hypothetical protein
MVVLLGSTDGLHLEESNCQGKDNPDDPRHIWQ